MPSVSAAPEPAAETVVVEQKPAKRKRKKNTVGFFIGLGAVLVILGIAAAVVTIYLYGSVDKLKSPQAVLDRMIDTILDGDYEQALDCVYEYRYSSDLREEAEESLDLFSVKSFEEFGVSKESIKSLLTVRVKDQETVGKRDEEAILSTLTESGVTTDPIEEIVRAEVTISMMGEDSSVKMAFVKADGGWYLLISDNPLSDSDGSLFE